MPNAASVGHAARQHTAAHSWTAGDVAFYTTGLPRVHVSWNSSTGLTPTSSTWPPPSRTRSRCAGRPARQGRVHGARGWRAPHAVGIMLAPQLAAGTFAALVAGPLPHVRARPAGLGDRRPVPSQVVRPGRGSGAPSAGPRSRTRRCSTSGCFARPRLAGPRWPDHGSRQRLSANGMTSRLRSAPSPGRGGVADCG